MNTRKYVLNGFIFNINFVIVFLGFKLFFVDRNAISVVLLTF